LAGFFIEFAQANLDAHAQLYQVLQHRIMEIQRYMPEMMDYMRIEAPEDVYDNINGLYEKSANEADIRKRYVKLVLAYLGILLYLSLKAEVLLEKAAEYLKEKGQV
jgi:hypothetical protein